MFFYPDSHDAVTQTQALKSFTLCSDLDGQYNVTIKNPLQFQLIIAYLPSGLSFRHAENVLSQMKKLTTNAQLGSISSSIVANYACIICALNLQKFFSILNDTSI